MGSTFSHRGAGHRLSRKEFRLLPRLSSSETVDSVKLDAGRRRLNLEPARASGASVVFRVPQEQGADALPESLGL